MSKRCVERGCRLKTWAESPFCFGHFIDHVSRSLSDKQRASFLDHIDVLLKTTSYREREIIKLRYGLGGMYYYTCDEVGRIFKISSKSVRSIEQKALQKILHPARFMRLSKFLDVYQLIEPDEKIVSTIHICESELLAYVSKNPNRLRSVTPDVFERIIAEILIGFGFQVQLTPKTRDGGCDIIGFTSDHLGITTKYIVECKRYAKDRPVHVELVRSLYGVKQQKRADHAILATTSYFTADSIRYCQSPDIWNLHLKDFESIKEWLDTYEEMIKKGGVLI
ncbi:MAG: restriction endonuclease [Phycisphaerae bacterium]